MATAAAPPTNTATSVAITANRNDVSTASHGSATGRLAGPVPPSSPSARQADRLSPPPAPRNDPTTSRVRGTSTTATRPMTVADTRTR